MIRVMNSVFPSVYPSRSCGNSAATGSMSPCRRARPPWKSHLRRPAMPAPEKGLIVRILGDGPYAPPLGALETAYRSPSAPKAVKLRKKYELLSVAGGGDTVTLNVTPTV